MRRLIGTIILAALTILLTTPVSAQDRPFKQTHSIEIEVECMDTATEIIRGLNGYNLDSSIFLHEQFGRTPQRRANFTRRVDAFAFRHVQEVLRSLGEVISEHEHAQFLGAHIMDVDARLEAISQEIDRLTLMMAASDSLDVLITIDSRLSQLIWERNGLIGRRNVLNSQVQSPVITIRLFEAQEELPEPEQQGFGSRVGERFSASWRNTLRGAGNLLVFLIRISIPLVLICGAVVISIFVLYRWWQKRKRREIYNVQETPDTTSSPDNAETDNVQEPLNTTETDTPSGIPETSNDKED